MTYPLRGLVVSVPSFDIHSLSHAIGSSIGVPTLGVDDSPSKTTLFTVDTHSRPVHGVFVDAYVVYAPSWTSWNRLLVSQPAPLTPDAYTIGFVAEPADTVEFVPSVDELSPWFVGELVSAAVQDPVLLLPVNVVQRDVVRETLQRMSEERPSFLQTIHGLFYLVPKEQRQRYRQAVTLYILGVSPRFPNGLPQRLIDRLESDEARILRNRLIQARNTSLEEVLEEHDDVHPHDLSYFLSFLTKNAG